MTHYFRSLALRILSNSSLEMPIRRFYTLLSPSSGARSARLVRRAVRSLVREDSTCVDVGAYRGDILSEMLKLASKGNVVAFEPNPDCCLHLERRFEEAAVHSVALADHSGSASFFQVLGRPARSGLRRQSYPDQRQEVREISVQIETLDRVLHPTSRLDLVKVDVEGAELQVFRGAEQLIRQHRPALIFEHAPSTASRFHVRSEEIYDFLASCGLGLSSLSGWFREEGRLSRTAFLDLTASKTDLDYIAFDVGR